MALRYMGRLLALLKTNQIKLPGDKRSSLFCSGISDEEKSFITLTPKEVVTVEINSNLLKLSILYWHIGRRDNMQHNDMQHNDMQHNDIQHNWPIWDTPHN
jgi:hypothetical protein